MVENCKPTHCHLCAQREAGSAHSAPQRRSGFLLALATGLPESSPASAEADTESRFLRDPKEDAGHLGTSGTWRGGAERTRGPARLSSFAERLTAGPKKGKRGGSRTLSCSSETGTGPGGNPAPASRRDARQTPWNERAPAPCSRRSSGTRTGWKRGWMTTGTLPSLTLLERPPGKKKSHKGHGQGPEA